MGIFSCDKYKRNGIECSRKPWAELYFQGKEEEDSFWVYVCFWHYLIERFWRSLGKRDFGACRIDTNREAIEHILMEIWDVQSDLIEIKKKLGIKGEHDDEIEEIMKDMDVT